MLGRIGFHANGALAAALKPKERISSRFIRELSLSLCTKTSYRNAASIMNDVYFRSGSDAFIPRTLKNKVEAAGAALDACLDAMAANALSGSPFDPETGLLCTPEEVNGAIRMPSCPDECPDPSVFFADRIASYNKGKESRKQIKDASMVKRMETAPESCVYISIDEVGVKRQKEHRRESSSKATANVENTVIHVQANGRSHVITSISMDGAFRLLVAFLLSSRLMENRHLVFFSDGAQNIRKAIETYFPFCPYVHMLDWFHLEKRMNELLSMALKGSKKDRRCIRETLDGILWAGNVDDAIAYISGLDHNNIKNTSKLQDATDYLERKRPFLCCYALRSVCGYRNSSNPAEKANDTVVAARQKHNGMSWSFSGSHCLAVLTATCRNGELTDWIRSGNIRFSMSDDAEEAA